MIGPSLMKEMEKEVAKIRQNLKLAHDRQKSYENHKRVHKEFNFGGHVYLHVRLRKSSLKLGSCAKFSPRYYGPFEDIYRIGPVEYRLTLPTNTKAQDVFNVSLLRKYGHDPNYVIDWDVILVETNGEWERFNESTLVPKRLFGS